MSNDEQTIYISPDDDLTNVRERLENLPSRRITLVIPRQTMLRSHVAWRNLYARAKELEKDVLIISADAQIRSLAQAAKFRVAHSLESSPTGKSRLGTNRSGRANPAFRMRSTPLRPSTGRGTAPESEPETPRSINRPDLSAQSPGRTTRASNYPSTYQGPESTVPLSNEVVTGGLIDSSSTYDPTDNSYGQSYDYSIEPSPFQPLPLSPQHLEEEPDLLDEDYRKTLDIHQSALEGQQGVVDSKPPLPNAVEPARPAEPIALPPVEPEPPTFRMAPLPSQEEDPFFYMEEDALPPPPRSEQHGEVSIEGFDTVEQPIHDISPIHDASPIHDISEMPTGVIHHDIEDQGDLGDFVHPNSGPEFVRNWMDSMPEDDQDMSGPSGASRAYGVRPRSSRTGKTSSPSPRGNNGMDASTPIEDRPTITPEQQQPPIRSRLATPQEPLMPAQPTPVIPLSPVRSTRPSQKLAAERNKQAAAQQAAQGQQAQQTPARQPIQRAGASRVGTNRTSSTATKNRVANPPRTARRVPRRQASRIGIALIAIVALFFILLGLIAFAYPTADVTITVASRSFSSPVTLLASPQSAVKPGVVPATTSTQTFGPMTGTGTVSGSTQIGTAKATGTVTFINNGSAPVDIPTGTVIQTPQGTQFVTTADVLVNTSGSAATNSIPAPVQAQQSGESGNVPAGSITIIPSSSLSTIAQQPNNPPLANIKLTVNNDSPLTGGGVGTASTVAQSDIDKVKQSLRTQMQGNISNWEKQQTHPGDVAGTPNITEALIDAPTVGQTVDNGSFTLGLKLTVTMLIVRNADIQKAAIAALNDTISKSKQPANANYHVASDANHPVAIQNLKTKQTSNALTLTFTANGQIVPNLPTGLQRLIVGKFKQDAKVVVAQYVPGTQNVDIKTNPGFYPLIPYLTGHVNIQLIPGTPITPTKK